jgi:diguanylate cyclase (GGDEF)-like protein
VNYGAIPNFLAIGVIVVLSLPLLRFGHAFRFRYWLAGWLLILLHALLIAFDFPSPNAPATYSALQYFLDATIDATLSLASVFFVCATGMPQRAKPYLPVLAAIPNLIYVVCGNLNVASRPLYYTMIILGAATVTWAIRGGAFPYRGHRWGAYLTIVAVYVTQAWLLGHVSLDVSESWLICWPYLLVACLFWSNAPKINVGVVITSASFMLWGLVFPASWLLWRYFPALQIETQVWNIPKFLALSGMIMTLLEEQMVKMESLAMQDSLTGLPNSRAFAERFQQALQRAQRAGHRIALLAIDLNDFKRINDTLGHQAGDKVLQAVAVRFRRSIRVTDMLARTGGDEFTVIVEGPPDRVAANKIIESLSGSLREPFAISGRPVDVDASFGLALYPDDTPDPSDLQVVADRQMYSHKAAIKQRIPLTL